MPAKKDKGKGKEGQKMVRTGRGGWQGIQPSSSFKPDTLPPDERDILRSPGGREINPRPKIKDEQLPQPARVGRGGGGNYQEIYMQIGQFERVLEHEQSRVQDLTEHDRFLTGRGGSGNFIHSEDSSRLSVDSNRSRPRSISSNTGSSSSKRTFSSRRPSNSSVTLDESITGDGIAEEAAAIEEATSSPKSPPRNWNLVYNWKAPFEVPSTPLSKGRTIKKLFGRAPTRNTTITPYESHVNTPDLHLITPYNYTSAPDADGEDYVVLSRDLDTKSSLRPKGSRQGNLIPTTQPSCSTQAFSKDVKRTLPLPSHNWHHQSASTSSLPTPVPQILLSRATSPASFSTTLSRSSSPLPAYSPVDLMMSSPPFSHTLTSDLTSETSFTSLPPSPTLTTAPSTVISPSPNTPPSLDLRPDCLMPFRTSSILRKIDGAGREENKENIRDTSPQIYEHQESPLEERDNMATSFIDFADDEAAEDIIKDHQELFLPMRVNRHSFDPLATPTASSIYGDEAFAESEVHGYY